MKLQIQDGAPLHTADGAKAGKIDGIVIDPLTHDVSHIVVNEGLFSTHKVVAPLSAIRMASAELATLDREIDLAEFPPLDVVGYTHAGDEPISDRPDAYVLPSQFSSPTVWLSPAHSHENYVATGAEEMTTSSLPGRAVTVGVSTAVVAAGRQQVGSVAGVLATDLGQATHLVIDADSAAASLALPAQWIEDITADEVRLGVTAQLVASAESPIDVMR